MPGLSSSLALINSWKLTYKSIDDRYLINDCVGTTTELVMFTFVVWPYWNQVHSTCHI